MELDEAAKLIGYRQPQAVLGSMNYIADHQSTHFRVRLCDQRRDEIACLSTNLKNLHHERNGVGTRG